MAAIMIFRNTNAKPNMPVRFNFSVQYAERSFHIFVNGTMRAILAPHHLDSVYGLGFVNLI
jgi:hypothetical protein